MAGLSQVCGVVDALSNFQVQVMNALNGRFLALRRLAELLEAAGDLTGFIPDISKLIPLYQIDASIYENLRVECPFLNLPPASENAEQFIGGLRAQLNAAYAQILRQLDLHPFSRIGLLQQKLDDFQSRLNLAALQGTDFLQCLQAACQAAQAVSNISAPDVGKIATDYYKNFIQDQGQVLSAQAKAKVSTVGSVKTKVQELISGPPPAVTSSASAVGAAISG